MRVAPLREEQVQRYSRAILLKAVGGQGQEALLSTGARLTAGGAALLTAAAYLGAGGTPVGGPPGALGAEDAGFLVASDELGRPAAPTVRAALGALNPDAIAAARQWGTLLALPGRVDGGRPLVAVGRRDGRWMLWAAGEGSCAECLEACVRGAEAPGHGPEAIQAGALVAVLFERLVLGLGPPLSGMALGVDGSLEVLKAPDCGHSAELPASVLAQVVRHLEACYPEEGCGVVLRGPAGARWVALRNAYSTWAARDPVGFPRDARSAFLFEPLDWLQLLREADRRGERVEWIVHAHPDGQALFSSEDRAQAAPGGQPLVPGARHLVVALRRGRATSASQVVFQAGNFRESPFVLPG